MLPARLSGELSFLVRLLSFQVALGILQRIGFKEVVCAADGVNALSEMTVRGGGDAFDIVLTDLHMPRKVCLLLQDPPCEFNISLDALMSARVGVQQSCLRACCVEPQNFEQSL